MFGLQIMNEMRSLEREMNQALRHMNFVEPAAGKVTFKVRDKGDSFAVEAALPGLDVEKLEIDVIGRKLGISGAFKESEVDAGARWHRRERLSGRFEQSLLLAAELDTEKVAAKYEYGILTIDLPKAAQAVPKKISVKVG